MNAGSQPSFVDTNVLVYAVADDDPVRQLAAQTLVDTLAAAQHKFDVLLTIDRKMEFQQNR